MTHDDASDPDLAASGNSDRRGERIGPYILRGELGRGGQAVVFLAEDSRLGRRVALKVLPGLAPGMENALARLRREAQVTSRLEHPSICGLFDLGVENGVAYLAMRYVEGETLAKKIATAAQAHDMPGEARIAEILRFFESAAHALHAAHEAGVIHRDIKPANLMVTPDGAPVVLDFGLAQQDEAAQAVLTASGGLSGTPAYMSPEQVRGADRLDRRTDVYSLAATLYEALTQEHPFAAATREEIFHTILNVDSPDPRRKNPAVPRDLATVLATALEKKRDRRYESAAAFAEDLRRVREHEPIRARRVGWLERGARTARRNPALAASCAGLVVLLLVISGLASYGLGAADKAELEGQLRVRASADRDAAERERRHLEQIAADRRFVERMDELSLELGTLIFGLQSKVDLRPLARRYRDAIEAHGIALTRGSAEDAHAAAAALLQRDPLAGDTLFGGLRSFAYVVQHARAQAGSAGAIEPELDAAVARAQEISARHLRAELREIQRVTELWEREQRDELEPLLTDEFFARCTPEEIGELMNAAVSVEGRSDQAFDALERAIRMRPDSFPLRYARGGLGLALAASKGEDREAARAEAEAALRHMEVAVALRPRSGLTRSLLGTLQAMSERYREALESVEASVLLEPDSALVWLMKGWFYSYTPTPQKAVEALRRALELDPSLELARETLQKIEQRAEGGGPPGR